MGFWDAAGKFVQLLADRSQYSIRAMKEIVDALASHGVNRESDVDAAVARWLATPSDDRAIGVDAFLGKQQPTFTWGRAT